VFLIVRHPCDAFAERIAAQLRERGYSVRAVDPCGLADLGLSLSEEALWIDGALVRGVLFRALPRSHFSPNFTSADRSFCDAELSAVWIAALHVPSLVTLNHYDAEAWCENARWPVWRRRLLAENVPSCPLTIGRQEVPSRSDRWLPYGSRRTLDAPGPACRGALAAAIGHCDALRASLLVCGEVLSGPTTQTVKRVAELLDRYGVRLAEMNLDQQGRVIHVNTLPLIQDSALLSRACELVVRFYETRLSGRRSE
jgi:hypothetical protein